MKPFRKYFKYDFEKRRYTLKFYDEANKLIWDTYIYHRDELNTHVEAFKSNLLSKNWKAIQRERQAPKANSQALNTLLARRMAIMRLI